MSLALVCLADKLTMKLTFKQSWEERKFRRQLQKGRILRDEHKLFGGGKLFKPKKEHIIPAEKPEHKIIKVALGKEQNPVPVEKAQKHRLFSFKKQSPTVQKERRHFSLGLRKAEKPYAVEQKPESQPQKENVKTLRFHFKHERTSAGKSLSRNYLMFSVIITVVVIIIFAYHFGYLQAGIGLLTGLSKGSAKSVSSLSPSYPGSPPPPPANNKNVDVNYINMQTNFSTNQYASMSISSSINSFNVTPGTTETVVFDLSIPPGTSNSPSSVTLTNLVVNTSGFSIGGIKPALPITVSKGTNSYVTVNVITPSVPYYGSLTLRFDLTPYYASNTTNVS